MFYNVFTYGNASWTEDFVSFEGYDTYKEAVKASRNDRDYKKTIELAEFPSDLDTNINLTYDVLSYHQGDINYDKITILEFT